MSSVLKRTFTLGRYHCVERMGSGPLCETWRAKLYGIAGLERQVTVRRVHAHLLSDRSFVQRLTAAVKVYQGLGEAGIAGLLPVRDVEQRGQQYYLVLDFAGADLTRLVPAFQQVLPLEAKSALPAVAALIGAELSATLSALHGRGVLHGGLCPQAVHLDPAGRALLADVGLMAARQVGDWLSEPDMAPLLRYLAPEVLRGEAADARSEVFSLGVMLFELLFGAAPFAGDHAEQLLASIERGAELPPSSAQAPLAEELGQRLRRALSSRREERQAGMDELHEELSQPAVSGREQARAILAEWAGWSLHGNRQQPASPSSVSEPGADPLPPPPGARSEDGRGFLPALMMPSRASDALRAAEIPQLVGSGNGSGRLASEPPRRNPRAEAMASTASRIMERDAAMAQVAVAVAPPASEPAAPARAGQRGGFPEQHAFFHRLGLPASAFASDEEESTVPVPYSPRSKIVTMDADPPVGLSRGFGNMPDETPLPVSIPFAGTNPGIEVTAVSDGFPRFDLSRPNPAQFPPAARPASDPVALAPPAVPQFPSADSGGLGSDPTVLAFVPQQPGDIAPPQQGVRTPLARIIPGRSRSGLTPTLSSETFPARVAGEEWGRVLDRLGDTTLAGAMGDEGADARAVLGAPPVAVVAREPAAAPPEVQEPMSALPGELAARAGRSVRQPAGFTEFDEPTALADYADEALAGLVSLSSRDKSGPVNGNPARMLSRSTPPSEGPGRGALEGTGVGPADPTQLALAESYAPLITAPVSLASTHEVSFGDTPRSELGERVKEMTSGAHEVSFGDTPRSEPAHQAGSPRLGTVGAALLGDSPYGKGPTTLAESAAEMSPPGSWPLPAPSLVKGEVTTMLSPALRRGTAALVMTGFLCSVAAGISAPLIYRAVRSRGGERALVRGPDRLPAPPRRPITQQAAPHAALAINDRSEAPRKEHLPALPDPAERPSSPANQADSPASSPPAEKGPGKLSLSSIPSAAIFIDGKPAGRTPATVSLSGGVHHLVLLAEQRKIWRQDITAGPPLSIALETAQLSPPLAGKAGLKVRCASKGKLRILVDGADTGANCPTSRIELSPGTHEVGFLEPATGQIQVRPVEVKTGNHSTRLYTKL